ncbi:MAG: hypothetical protein HOQ45_10580 [Nocardioidaceae bacterium]|nr:hypothetical protein [Nocardioidaceae bacterium]
MTRPPSGYPATRRALHGLAELVIAGPRFRESGDLRLRVLPGGFGTWAEPWVRLDHGDLVAGDTRVPVDGARYADLARAIGGTATRLDDVYDGGPGVNPGATVHVDPVSVGVLVAALEVGDAALALFSRAADPVLWPEHFDVGITLGEVNYGLSPGDDYEPAPYAYVGPHTVRAGDFWNAPFGAVRRLAELGDAAGTAAFFAEGARIAA